MSADLVSKVVRPDLNRIVGKLIGVHKAVSGKDSILVKFIIREVLDDYVMSVTSAMGVVSSDGGSVTPDAFMGVTRSLTWEPLAMRTIAKKMKKGWHTEIWAARTDGQGAKDKVKVHTQHTKLTHEMFAGLRPSDGAAYTHALRSEFGQGIDGHIVPRALFTIMNDIFATKSYKIAAELQKLIIHSAKWGK